ncbi:MAG TPA: chemotaxis protein CheW [Feifaniaceae bacterium]|nr:chemotaxis protein CheW [Feifaniaceae bacterium]
MSLMERDLFEDTDDTQQSRYLTFGLGEEIYGLDIGCVTEIIGLMPISPLPEMPLFIRGVINLRGKIIPVMDLRLRFKMPVIEYGERTCIVIIDNGALNAGLIVEHVADVVQIDEANIVPPPTFEGLPQNRCVSGIEKSGGSVKMLLDCTKLLKPEEEELLMNL